MDGVQNLINTDCIVLPNCDYKRSDRELFFFVLVFLGGMGVVFSNGDS